MSAWFPVKYVCGETQPGGRLVPGHYSTVVNVLNLSKFAVRIGWWFSSGLGRPGIAGAQAEILGHASLFMDCAFITSHARAGRRRGGQCGSGAHAAWGAE